MSQEFHVCALYWFVSPATAEPSPITANDVEPF
jgi:hypothetical protein